MLDKKTHMMDAGMRLFESEKPYGTVLGGIKTEMAKYGATLRAKELENESIPGAAAGCDLLLDRSNRMKVKYITCVLEDAGVVGKNPDGEEIHRYAASLKEGNKNTSVGIYVSLALVIIWAMLGWLVTDGNGWITLALTIVGLYGAWRSLRPSRDNTKIVSELLEAFENAK